MLCFTSWKTLIICSPSDSHSHMLPTPLDMICHCNAFVSVSFCELQGVIAMVEMCSFCAKGRLVWTLLKTWPKKSTSHHWNWNLSFNRHLYPMQMVPQGQLRAKCLAQGQNGTAAGLWPQENPIPEQLQDQTLNRSAARPQLYLITAMQAFLTNEMQY